MPEMMKCFVMHGIGKFGVIEKPFQLMTGEISTMNLLFDIGRRFRSGTRIVNK